MKSLTKWLFISFIMLAGTASAQGNGRQKIESAKIALITNRLNLTPEQAPQFWAVYNEYNGRKHDLNRHVRQLNNAPGRQNIADSDVLLDLKEINATKQKLADLDNEYLNKFLKVISPTQVAELYKTEQDFNKILLQRMKQGR
ncbi:MAG: hypothetical protein H7Z72_02020 [Bacteroidetes bacterium]|nr:hypothetical protein [Fibrella sp.]